MWSKGNPLTLLVGTDTATVEDNMEIPSKKEN